MSEMEYNKGKLIPTDLTIKNVVDMILEKDQNYPIITHWIVYMMK